MTSGKSNLVDITVEIRSDDATKSAIAVWDGKRSGGQGGQREEWIWLPRSQIEVTPMKGNTVEIALPEWLAKDKGLI